MNLDELMHQVAVLKDFGHSFIRGHRFILLRCENATVNAWMRSITPSQARHPDIFPPGCPADNTKINRDLLSLPAANIIMSIPQDMSDRDLLEKMGRGGNFLRGVLMASRGKGRATPCGDCTTKESRLPFEKCFVVEGFEHLGCATCWAVSDFDDWARRERCIRGGMSGPPASGQPAAPGTQ